MALAQGSRAGFATVIWYAPARRRSDPIVSSCSTWNVPGHAVRVVVWAWAPAGTASISAVAAANVASDDRIHPLGIGAR